MSYCCIQSFPCCFDFTFVKAGILASARTILVKHQNLRCGLNLPGEWAQTNSLLSFFCKKYGAITVSLRLGRRLWSINKQTHFHFSQISLRNKHL